MNEFSFFYFPIYIFCTYLGLALQTALLFLLLAASVWFPLYLHVGRFQGCLLVILWHKLCMTTSLPLVRPWESWRSFCLHLPCGISSTKPLAYLCHLFSFHNKRYLNGFSLSIQLNIFQYISFFSIHFNKVQYSSII